MFSCNGNSYQISVLLPYPAASIITLPRLLTRKTLLLWPNMFSSRRYKATWYKLFDCKIYPASLPTWFEKPRTITDGYSPIMSWLFVSANKVEYYCFPLFIITTIIPVSFLADVCFLTYVFFVTWPLSEVCHYPVYKMRIASCWSDL